MREHYYFFAAFGSEELGLARRTRINLISNIAGDAKVSLHEPAVREATVRAPLWSTHRVRPAKARVHQPLVAYRV